SSSSETHVYPPPTPVSALTTAGGAEPSAGATTRSARPSAAATHARRAPVGDQRGSATDPDPATIAGVILRATHRSGESRDRWSRGYSACPARPQSPFWVPHDAPLGPSRAPARAR